MLNKKGMTSVELLVCFVIISAIVVSMYNLILNYRNREQIEEVNNEVISFSNNLQKVIQTDLIMGHLIDVTDVSENGYNATFSFDNPDEYSTYISIKPDEGIISYGKSDNIIDYKIPAIADLSLSPDSSITYVSSSNEYLKINIILTHPNFPDETYSFMINCPLAYSVTVGDKPASDVIIDNLTCNSIYNDGTDTFITSLCGDPNNYIWYSGKLWRAVSINNETRNIKLVTQWNMSAIPHSSGSSAFKNSYVEYWLNDTSTDGFLGNLRDYENFIVTNTKWDATTTTTALGSLTRPKGTTTVTNAVGLLNLYEYQESIRGSSYSEGYLNNGLYWWTLTPYSSAYIRSINRNGNSNNNYNPVNGCGIRPAIVIKSDVSIVAGTGTASDPYRFEGDSDINLAGTLLNTRYSGEYVQFGTGNNNLYMIVNHETSGLTKIVSASPLNNSKTFNQMVFGSSVKYSSTNTIGKFLNGTFLTSYVGSTYSNMISNNTTWYLGTSGSGQSYRLSKYTTATGTTLTSNKITAKVGLLRLGELMSSHYDRNIGIDGSATGLTTTYWLITPRSSSLVNISGYAYGSSPTEVSGIRPSLNLKSNVVITGGEGTKDNPFTIKLQ